MWEQETRPRSRVPVSLESILPKVPGQLVEGCTTVAQVPRVSPTEATWVCFVANFKLLARLVFLKTLSALFSQRPAVLRALSARWLRPRGCPTRRAVGSSQQFLASWATYVSECDDCKDRDHLAFQGQQISRLLKVYVTLIALFLHSVDFGQSEIGSKSCLGTVFSFRRRTLEAKLAHYEVCL